MKQEIKNFGYFVLISFFSLFRIDYLNRHHLTIEFVDRQLKVKLQKHHEYVEEVQEILDKVRKKYRPKKFITYAIEKSKDCNYVVFTCGPGDKFLQFWQGDGKIVLDYPILKTNELGRYKYQVLGLLAEMGFYKMSSKGKLLDYFFKYETVEKDIYIKVNFVHDIDLTSKFISIVISEFFRQDLKQISARAG